MNQNVNVRVAFMLLALLLLFNESYCSIVTDYTKAQERHVVLVKIDAREPLNSEETPALTYYLIRYLTMDHTTIFL